MEGKTRKFNLRAIMLRAWRLHREKGLAFPEALHRAWMAAKAEPVNAGRIETAKAAAGVTERTETWSGWKKLGYEVIHGSKALFGCDLIYVDMRTGEVLNVNGLEMNVELER